MKEPHDSSTDRGSRAPLPCNSSLLSPPTLGSDTQCLSIAAARLLRLGDSKYDFSSEAGQDLTRGFLQAVQSVITLLRIEVDSRQYRLKFSQAYRQIFQSHSLGYLSQIIDSAQQSSPYLWVNGQQYIFSAEVLEAGFNLFVCFQELTSSLGSEDPVQVPQRLRCFDECWVAYEHMYILELMVIESDARRYIRKAIEAEQGLRRKPGKKQDLRVQKRALVRLLGKINSVANTEGKGRDDLTLDILEAAEQVNKRPRQSQSLPVGSLASAVVRSFNGMRLLLQRYAQNIEEVDPQLMNNPELVAALTQFENSWSKAKNYLISPKRRDQLNFFAQYLSSLGQRYPSLAVMMECRDFELFMILPSLLVLLCLEGRDMGLCQLFCPPMAQKGHPLREQLESARRALRAVGANKIAYANKLKRAVLGICKPLPALKEIKMLGMELQRHCPADWNQFLEIALLTN